MKIGSQAQLIGNRGNQQIPRRHLPCFGGTANSLHGGVFGAIHGLTGSLDDIIICGDTMDGRHGARINTAMARPGKGGNVIYLRVFAAKAIVQQTFEPIALVAVIKAVQIIPAHLVDHDAYYQFWSG